MGVFFSLETCKKFAKVVFFNKDYQYPDFYVV